MAYKAVPTAQKIVYANSVGGLQDKIDTELGNSYELYGQIFTPDSVYLAQALVKSERSFSVVTADDTGNIFVISGDKTARFSAGDPIYINGSTGNDGAYTVASVSYDSGNDETDISVNENVADATNDGNVLLPENDGGGVSPTSGASDHKIISGDSLDDLNTKIDNEIGTWNLFGSIFQHGTKYYQQLYK